MSDRVYQERANQQNQTVYGRQQQQPVYYHQQQQHPQPTNQQNASFNQHKMDKSIGGNTQQSQPQTVYSTGHTQGQLPPQHVIILVPASQNYSNLDGSSPDASTPWAGSSFVNKKIRHAFIRKVYLILTALLLVTVAFICVFLFVDPVKQWVRHNSWFLWVSFGVYFIAYIILICCDNVRRSFPANYICLAIFNLAFSYVCAAISSYYSTQIVLIAIGITTLVCLSVSIFAIQTRIDFTLCAGLLFVLSMVLMIFGLVCVFVYLFLGPNYILTCVYGALAALVFTLFLAYDTQVVIGGRKYQLSPEEYIAGALQLYMDVGTMYLIILSFFGCVNQ